MSHRSCSTQVPPAICHLIVQPTRGQPPRWPSWRSYKARNGSSSWFRRASDSFASTSSAALWHGSLAVYWPYLRRTIAERTKHSTRSETGIINYRPHEHQATERSTGHEAKHEAKHDPASNTERNTTNTNKTQHTQRNRNYEL